MKLPNWFRSRVSDARLLTSLFVITLLSFLTCPLKALEVHFAVNDEGATAASNSNQFTIEDSLGLRSLTWLEAPALSPDGRYVAYLISYLGPETRHDGKHQEMWLVDTKTKQTTLITDEAWECSKPTWSPDGKRLAFYDKIGSGTGIRVWSLETKTTKLLVSDIERSSLLPWSPDGRFVFAKRTPKPKEEQSSASTKVEDSKSGITVYRSQKNADKAAVETGKDVESSILEIDTESGAEKTIVRRNKMEYFAVSPNGKFIAWYENGRFFNKPEFYRLGDIGIVTMSTGAVQIAAHDFRDLFDMYGDALSWSPDGNTLGVHSIPITARGHSSTYFVIDAAAGSMRSVYTSEHPQDDGRFSILQWVNEKQFIVKEGGEGRELWLVSIDGRMPYRIYESTSGNIRGFILGANRWDVWHPKPDTLAIFIRRNDTMKAVPVLVNYAKSSSSELPALSRFTWPTVWLPHGVDSTGSAVVEFQDPTHPQDLYQMSADGSLDQLTHINPQIGNKKLGSARLLEWQENGKPKRAVLLLPADYVPGNRYPTIVSQYSGIVWSPSIFMFGLESADSINQQLYASRGYAVLVPDIDLPVLPKNMGAEGQGYYASERPNLLEAIARQINTAVDYAVKQGYVDPDRLGITGTSNGGYGVMCTIVSTLRFKAAIARATVVDEMSDSWQFTNGRGDWGPLAEDEFGTTLWKDRELYIANSPFYFLDRVQTPLLLTRGTKDGVVTTQPQQAYIGMKQLGKDVTLVEYEGEDHLDAEWTYAHRKDLLERMLQFFDEHLKSQ